MPPPPLAIRQYCTLKVWIVLYLWINLVLLEQRVKIYFKIIYKINIYRGMSGGYFFWSQSDDSKRAWTSISYSLYGFPHSLDQ
jgi:hypothetical protein